jgi:hypothetical protein
LSSDHSRSNDTIFFIGFGLTGTNEDVEDE